MHINDGILNPINPITQTVNTVDLAILIVTWAITVPFLVFAWKKTMRSYSQSIAPTLAVMSALVFVIQMLTFPVAGGTSVHIVGGTLLAVVLGPFPAMISMSIVLLMQAVFFGDGGFLAFGANAVNMAIIGGLSFYIVKGLMGKSYRKDRLATSVFVATFISSILCALATGLQVGLASTFANAGGLMLTVPTMLGVYSVAGLVEAFATSFIVVMISFSLRHLQPAGLYGLSMLRGKGMQ
jgi:cobalt/nickel transport system permease protein